MKAKVLVLEQDESLIDECRSFFVGTKIDTAAENQETEVSKTFFENDDYAFTIVNNFDSAVKTLIQNHFDIVVANLTLATQESRNLFDWLHSRQKDIPIIVLGQDITKQMAVDLIHYHIFALIEKPISMEFLKAKLEEANQFIQGELVASQLRAQSAGEAGAEGAKPREVHREFIPYLGVELDYDLRLVRSGNTEITLTPSEFTILELLIGAHGRRISREEISQALWGKSVVSKNTLNTHLYNLKNKIPGLTDKLKVIYGSGYVLSP